MWSNVNISSSVFFSWGEENGEIKQIKTLGKFFPKSLLFSWSITYTINQKKVKDSVKWHFFADGFLIVFQ